MSFTKRTWGPLAALTVLAVVVAACQGEVPTPTPTPTPTATPAPTSTPIPVHSASDIVFKMKDRYQLGEPIEIRIRNQSKTGTYYYQAAYPACYNLKFFDRSTERRPYPYADPVQSVRFLLTGQFIVARGTHCDIISENPLRPGEEVVLLTWNQDMCIKDSWGCVESTQVSRGEYRIIGEFAQSSGVIAPGRSQESAKFVVAEWEFVIE